MAITGRVGAVYTLNPEAVSAPFAGGAQVCTGCPERKRYRVAPALRYLDPNKKVTVYRNGEPVAGGFYIEHLGGCVVFNEAQEAGDEIKLLASHFDPSDIEQSGGCFEWSLSLSVDEKDVTTFKSAVDNNGWKSFMALHKGWTASASAYWGNYKFFESLGKMIVLKLYTDAGEAQDCFEGYAILTSDSVETPVDGIVEESVDFQGVGLLIHTSVDEEDEGEEGVQGAGMQTMGAPGGESPDDENEETGGGVYA